MTRFDRHCHRQTPLAPCQKSPRRENLSLRRRDQHRADPGHADPGHADTGRLPSGRAIRRGFLACAVVLALGCGPGPAPVESDDPVLGVVARHRTEISLDVEGRALPTAYPGDWLGLCYRVDPRTDTSRWRVRLDLAGEAMTAADQSAELPAPIDAAGSAPAPDALEAIARIGDTVCFSAQVPPASTRVAPSADGEEPPAAVTTSPVTTSPATTSPAIASPATASPTDTELCGRLFDELDGSERDLPCARVRLRSVDDRPALRQRRSEVLRAAWTQPHEQAIAALDDLADDVRDAGLLAMAGNLDLLTLHFLSREGTADALAEMGRRLDAMPDWMEQEAAATLGAPLAYQRSVLANLEGRRGDAWQHLATAEKRYRLLGRSALPASLGMADLLARAGAPREAAQRLAEALGECDSLRAQAEREVCAAPMLQAGRNTWVWLTLLDAEADAERLREARRLLVTTLEEGATDPLEMPNRWLNLAYLDLRLGQDPAEALERAERALGNLETGGDLRRRLRAWGRLIEAQSALDRGEPAAARERCAPLVADAEPRVAAMAASCAARALRALGDLDGAALRFEQAMIGHEAAFDWQEGRSLPLGPSQRAEDFYRAARVALERGEPSRAWDLLLRLDRLSVVEAARRRCRERAESEDERRRWAELEEESASILETLRALDGPASLERRRQQESLASDLRRRLRATWRDWPGCPAPADRPEPSADRGVDYRAVALADEVLLLHRHDDTVEVRRTPLGRGEVRQRLDQLDRLAPSSVDTAAWRRAAEPLARALLPALPAPSERDEARPTVVYALHGLLQEAPLVALPLPDGGWLGSRANVAVRAAGARAIQARGGHAPGPTPPVFVIDPSGNLPAAADMAETYRRLFPNALFLRGPEAVHGAVLEQVSTAEWLHVDAHGIYDGVAPELSALRMADRPLHWLELADTSPRLRFANLSGCQTGRWPSSADSGTYGLAGLLTRLGVPWAIGSRTNLPDEAAAALNRAFYERLAEGQDPARAFGAAIGAVAERYPPAAWSGLVLLEGAGARSAPRATTSAARGGQTRPRTTPETREPDRTGSPPLRRENSR